MSVSLLLLDFPNRRWWVHFSVFSRVLLELSVVGFLVVPLDVVLVSMFLWGGGEMFGWWVLSLGHYGCSCGYASRLSRVEYLTEDWAE